MQCLGSELSSIFGHFSFCVFLLKTKSTHGSYIDGISKDMQDRIQARESVLDLNSRSYLKFWCFKGVLSNLTVLLCKIILLFNFQKIVLNAKLKYILLDCMHWHEMCNLLIFSFYCYDVSRYLPFYTKQKYIHSSTQLQTRVYRVK